jgi:hypothetical protein
MFNRRPSGKILDASGLDLRKYMENSVPLTQQTEETKMADITKIV